MSTPAEQIHEVDLHFLVGRARACVLLLILSDMLSVLAILAAGGYLSALNTENQFVLPTDHGTAFVPSLVVAVALILSGLYYFWWARGIRRNQGTSQPIAMIIALILMVVALVVQTWIGTTLGYTAPFHAYDSLVLLLTWFTAVHLLLTALIGLLLLGRALRGRLVGHNYIAETTGYWWYYTVIASLLMWLFSAFIR
jgi:hypothetical protein